MAKAVKNRTARELWSEFWEAVKPVGEIPDGQYREMRRAFMGGMYAMLGASKEIGTQAYTVTEGVAYYKQLDAELTKFFDDLQKGLV